jgi:hypothetical protein
MESQNSMPTFEKIYRHGDVIIFRLSPQSNPLVGQTLKKISRLTLALGEVTGHAHRLEGELEVLENQKNTENEVYFQVLDQAVLTHEEHNAMVLEKGIYLKINQVEYDPFAEMIRYVRD